jgi:hypothetical protein
MTTSEIARKWWDSLSDDTKKQLAMKHFGKAHYSILNWQVTSLYHRVHETYSPKQ